MYFIPGKVLMKCCDIISGELEKLNIWFQVNKLSLNINTTQFMKYNL
jgi:hypothetical protein